MVAMRWPLTGREEELRVITDATHARDAAGVVLAGAAGVGKTRLARETLVAAQRRGRLCRSVVGSSSARSVPLGAFADYAAQLGPDPLGRVRAVVDAVTRTDPPGGVLLTVDDAHLLDDLSALVVHQIVRRRRATVMLTIRSGEPAPDAITGLWKDELLPRVEVQPLSATETAVLLEHALEGSVLSRSAQRIWRYTQGNVLFLTQLVADELAAGRLVHRSGVWLWDGSPAVSPKLVELVDAMIGRQPEPVAAVLEVLAVADPLPTPVLVDLVDAGAVDAAEARGLITVDAGVDPPVARLAHPMFGEVTRARTGTLRLRHLRGRVATGLASQAPHSDLIGVVARAVLAAESDLDPDPGLFAAASSAALKLMDPVLAERLARIGVDAGGGSAAQLVHAMALTSLARSGDATDVLRDMIAVAGSDHERVLLTILRAGIRYVIDGDETAVRWLAAIEDRVDGCGMRGPFDCVHAMVLGGGGQMARAVDLVADALASPASANEFVQLAGLLVEVGGFGELGRLDELDAAAARGYALTRSAANVATARFTLGRLHIASLWTAGLLSEAQRVARDLARDARDAPVASTSGPILAGVAALACGDLAVADRCLREGIVVHPGVAGTRVYGHRLLAVCLSMRGEPAAAAAALDATPTLEHPEMALHEPERLLATAWVLAAEGATSEAIAILQDAAERLRRSGRPAREVVCLQTAAQFGDCGVADRLRDLTAAVQGPRVHAASAHAAALRDNDGEGLSAAAELYEAFGDRVAAGDAAAQSATAFRAAGLRGRSLTAAASAHRLATATGARTPAIRAASTPVPLTRRQREIIGLAATGLSNREIADRLVMSVRTVEGHLFRASQKTRLNSRDDLVKLLGDHQ